MWMKHPVTLGLAETTQEAFDEVWSQEDPAWESYEPTSEEVGQQNQLTSEQFEEAAQPEDTVVIIHPDTLETAEVPESTVDEAWADVGWVRAAFDPDGNPILPPEEGRSDTGSDAAPDAALSEPSKARRARKAASQQPEAPEEV